MSKTGKPVIGVLALQGAVTPHKPHIEAAGGEFRAVKTAEEINVCDAYILPGGESTTMLKLIDTFGLWDTLAENFAKKPAWGICAGAILMAEKVTNPEQKSFALLPLTVERNGYGRQLESHHGEIDGYPVSFIRAPLFTNVGKNAQILAEHKGTPVWIKKDRYTASAFHPELTLDFPSPMHRAFIECLL
ncbi:MAG: pyridoxal 5'-phosphate synthase glutaminase subunit PdxT [Alphaproteobacteria bacterium]|nr:pyridoxal 5'-phosphate synthase glutaminase subunit PdxT [Alphaproteobacteria bacterium]MCB9974975.1 pyridoxal 5'-phosphate synthase glutaminase subunit PdxT [Rhodospirillales bacterium]